MRLSLPLYLLLAVVGCDSGGTPPDRPAMGAAQVPPARPAYPLRADGRHIVDRDGAAVLLHGDAAWSAIANLTDEEMEAYLADRQEKGFTAVYVNLVEKAFSDQTPSWLNTDGEAPFMGTLDGYTLDFSTPNEAYWRRVDTFVQLADEAGIVVVAFPAYTGWEQGADGWGEILDANGPGRMRAYGSFLGGRYADQPNLIWAAGGDAGPTGTYDLREEYAALAEGVRAHDAVHLWTGHGGQESGVEVYGDLGLDLNTTYRYPPASVPEAVRADYERAPAMPFVFFEGWYENEYGVSTRSLRLQAYTSLLGGAAGQFYGDNPVWYFGDGWEDALDDPGALDMVHVGDLFRSRAFERLVPDYESTVVLGDRGALTDGSYVAAARASDGSTILAYVPRQRSIEVDLAGLAGTEAQAWCFDPSTGVATDLGRFPTGVRYTIAPCATPDWVVVFDAAELGLPAPGTR